MLNVTLNNQDVTNECAGTETLTERVYWAVELRAFVTEMQGNLIFNGGAYNYLRDQYVASYSSIVPILIQSGTGITNGHIFINDIKWNLSQRTATCQIVVDPFLLLLDNNKSIEVTLNHTVTSSKNGVDISSRIAYQNNLTMLSPLSTSVTSPYPRYGWRVKDAFNYIVGFISDNRIGFVSDYFTETNTPSIAYSCLMTGREVMYGTDLPTDVDQLFVTISFQDLFSDLNKLHNLGMAIETINGQPYLRIEPIKYWNSKPDQIFISDNENLMAELDRSMFYSAVKMGSVSATSQWRYLRPISFYGHFQDQFYFEGQSNIDNTLDLQTNHIIFDTNAICASLPVGNGGFGVQDFEDDIMLVQFDSSNNTVLTPEPYSATDYYYNDIYRNVFTSERWNGWLPFALVQQTQSNQPLVRASGEVQQLNALGPNDEQPEYINDFAPPNFDPSGLWTTNGNIQIAGYNTPTIPVQTTLSYFTAPATDYYQFYVFQQVNAGAYAQTEVQTARWNGTHYVELGVDLQTIHNATQPPWGPPPNYSISQGIYINFVGNIEGTAGVYLEAGDIAYVRMNYVVNALIYNGVVEVNQYGGIFIAQQTNLAHLERIKIERPISDAKWLEVKNEPFGLLVLSYIDGSVRGRVRDFTRNVTTGQCSIDMASRRIDNP